MAQAADAARALDHAMLARGTLTLGSDIARILDHAMAARGTLTLGSDTARALDHAMRATATLTLGSDTARILDRAVAATTELMAAMDMARVFDHAIPEVLTVSADTAEVVERLVVQAQPAAATKGQRLVQAAVTLLIVSWLYKEYLAHPEVGDQFLVVVALFGIVTPVVNKAAARVTARRPTDTEDSE